MAGKVPVDGVLFARTYNDPKLTVAQVAEQLGISENQVRIRAKAFVKAGVALAVKSRAPGGRKIDAAAINAALASTEGESATN